MLERNKTYSNERIGTLLNDISCCLWCTQIHRQTFFINSSGAINKYWSKEAFACTNTNLVRPTVQHAPTKCKSCIWHEPPRIDWCVVRENQREWQWSIPIGLAMSDVVSLSQTAWELTVDFNAQNMNLVKLSDAIITNSFCSCHLTK